MGLTKQLPQMMERCYIGLLIFMLLVAAFLVDGMGHVPVNLFTWYSHVVLHVCKCVFIWVGGCVWV